MMHKPSKFAPSREGIGFCYPYLMNASCCTASRTRHTAHQRRCLMHGLRDIAQEHTPAASAAFRIAHPDYGDDSPFYRALGFVPHSEIRTGHPRKPRNPVD